MSKKDLPELISHQEIKNRTKKIADKINKNYQDKSPILICVLKGAFLFFSELIENINIDCEIEFMTISSYIGTSSKEIKFIEKDFSNLENREIIIVDDILDTGKTLNFMIKYIKQFNPKSIELITLLKRQGKNKYNIVPYENGFEIKDEFVIGYGLDFNEKYRNLNYISYL